MSQSPFDRLGLGKSPDPKRQPSADPSAQENRQPESDQARGRFGDYLSALTTDEIRQDASRQSRRWRFVLALVTGAVLIGTGVALFIFLRTAPANRENDLDAPATA